MGQPMQDEEDTGPKPWQRFFLGYQDRFVHDCVLELKVCAVFTCLACKYTMNARRYTLNTERCS